MNSGGIIARGDGWRIRELIDGRYVAEVYRRLAIRKRWVGLTVCENKSVDIGVWVAEDDPDYRYCLGTHHQCITALAESGIGRNMEERA